MPRRKAGKENIRNIQQSGGSYHISIPIQIMRSLGWREKQKVIVNKSGRGLRIVDWSMKKR